MGRGLHEGGTGQLGFVILLDVHPLSEHPRPADGDSGEGVGSWLKQKYGSLGAAFTAWGGQRIRGDDENARRAGFMELWQMFSQRNKRAQTPLSSLQSASAPSSPDARLPEADLGYKGLVQASNWITASAQILGPLDKWSNAVCDYMDRHGYFGGPLKASAPDGLLVRVTATMRPAPSRK